MSLLTLTDAQIGALVREYELSFTYHDNAEAGVPANQIVTVAITVTSNLGKRTNSSPFAGNGPHIHAALLNFLRMNLNLKADAERRIIGHNI